MTKNDETRVPINYTSEPRYEWSGDSTKFDYTNDEGTWVRARYDPAVRLFSAQYSTGDGFINEIGHPEDLVEIVTVDALVEKLQKFGSVPDGLEKTMREASHGKSPFPPKERREYLPGDTLDEKRVGPAGERAAYSKYDTISFHEGLVEVNVSFDYDRGRITAVIVRADDEENIIFRTKPYGVGSVRELEDNLKNVADIPPDARQELERLTTAYPPQPGRDDIFEINLHEIDHKDHYEVTFRDGYYDNPEDIMPEGHMNREDLVEFLKSYGLSQEYMDEIIGEARFNTGLSAYREFGTTGFDKSQEYLPKNEFMYRGRESNPMSENHTAVIVSWNPHDDTYKASFATTPTKIAEINDGQPIQGIANLATVVEEYGPLPERYKVMVKQAVQQHEFDIAKQAKELQHADGTSSGR